MRLFHYHILLYFPVIAGAISGPLTEHFQNWLQANNLSSYDFVREDYGTQGSYGGFESNGEQISNNPVIFLHGNSDSALKTNTFATGWDNSIQYFLDKGYKKSELYATSWQDNNSAKAATRTHDCKDLIRLRKFFEAVFAYTGASKVSLVSHSMGVTLGRKVIFGGIVNATDGVCDLGRSISLKIDVIVAMSGANFGLCSCTGFLSGFSATCNKKNGFWPGDACGSYTSTFCGHFSAPCNSLSAYSTFLSEMNKSSQKPSANLFSVWSKADNLINNGDLVWGQPTSLVPLSDGKLIYEKYTHMETKEMTAADQFYMVTSRTIPP